MIAMVCNTLRVLLIGLIIMGFGCSVVMAQASTSQPEFITPPQVVVPPNVTSPATAAPNTAPRYDAPPAPPSTYLSPPVPPQYGEGAPAQGYGQPPYAQQPYGQPSYGQPIYSPTVVGPPVPTVTETGPWTDEGPWFQNFVLYQGTELSKQPQDFGVNSQFGLRLAASGSVPLIEPWGVGLQLGTSINATDNTSSTFDRLDGTTGRFQSMSTIGVFQRLDSGWLWGVGYDFLYQNYYDQFFLTQWRPKLGYAFSIWNEVGMQGAISDRDSAGQYGPIPVRLRSINQGTLYWRHTNDNGAVFTLWGGLSGSHSQANLLVGNAPRTDGNFVYGSDMYIPMTERVSLYGEANFITPTNTGTVDAFLGFEWRPWGNTATSRRHRYAPVLPLSASTNFATDLLIRRP